MEKVRIGNDLRVNFSVYRNGEPESFDGATNISTKIVNESYNKTIAHTYSIVGNVVQFEIDALELKQCGKCRVFISYTKAGDYTVDSPAFELVQYTEYTGGTEIIGIEIVNINISGDIGINRDGASAYEVWESYPGNEGKTIEQYFEWLRENPTKIDLDGLNSNIDKLHFKPDTLVQLTNIGDVRYSPESKTLEVKVSDTVSIQLGQEMQTRVKNDEAVQINNGQMVYINSAVGANPLAKIASTSNPDVAQKTFGMATENIPANRFGAITTEGLVRDINTSAFPEGSMLWLGANGNVTNIEPTAPTSKISVGMVLRSNANNGIVYVKIRAIARNQKLSDVYAPTLTGGDILRWNNATLRFETFNITSALGSKVDTSRTITAGNGLTGGGDLTANRTIDINPADDSLTVTADNVKVNTNNTLTSTSTTQPLSANQGKVLNEKVVQVETDLNISITELQESVGLIDIMNPQLAIVKSGYYIGTTGKREGYTPLAIFTPIPVKSGDVIDAIINAYNSAITPLAWQLTNTTNSDMNCEVLCPYNVSNIYHAVVSKDGYVIVSADKTTQPTIKITRERVPYDFTQIENIAINTANIDILKGDIYGDDEETTSIAADNALVGYYLNGSKTDGSYASYANLSSVFFPIIKGIKYYIHVNQTTNSAAWILGTSLVNNRTQNATIIIDAGKGTWSAWDYEYISDVNGFLVIGIASGSETPTVTYRHNGLVSRVSNIEFEKSEIETNIVNIKKSNPLKGKKILIFGDSLVSASSNSILSVVGGFSKLIASRNDCDYERLIDVNTPSIGENDIIAIKNIARDGTTLMVRGTRNDSINERVHNWVNTNSCDLAVIQGGTNDFSSGTSESKGTISSHYDGGYDTTTSLGALEDIFYHITSLGIRVCFLIMHKVAYVPNNWYDDFKSVCSKWGIPYLDLEHSAGFYMCNENTLHGSIYSIRPADYNDDTTYYLDEKVTYGGSSYKCKVDGIKGILPTNSLKWTFVSNYPYDMCHLNDKGHEIVSYKIEDFIKSI